MVRPKKRLGQHFLNDDNIAGKIAGTLDPSIHSVLEIGPGTGILTKHILQRPGFDLQVIEIDSESVEYLRTHYPALGDRIICGDFLTLEPSSLRSPDAALQIIGNFPYNISSQILFRVLEWKDRVKQVTGMFQKEVAERIASPPGSKQYGILSVLLQAFYDIDYLFTVNPSVFYPQPKVKSAVIRLRRNNVRALDCDEHLFFNVVKTSFNQRRKTLRNSTRRLIAEHPATQPAILDLRPENLTVRQFTDLTLWIGAHSGKKS